MGLQEIADDTGYSVSTVCKNVNILERMTDVRRFKKPGSKKIYYECQHDIKKALRKKIVEQRGMVQSLVDILKDSDERLRNDEDPDSERIRKDLEKLRKDYEKVIKLLDIMSAMKLIGE
ncbi:MAG: hypothetical protein GF416_08225 [Candidatus Altiarchaeales archaeon]|nr:hypothetical protein [Candidatus Altiarchaeales archaeon]MBD3417101.1 hypothetical protein [Candidatus Altiarchaeales archaeon]